MILAHWTYTREEWKTYRDWNTKRKGMLVYLLHRFLPRTRTKTPEIRITPERVSIGERHHPFGNGQQTIKNIDIREEGTVNIISITYERTRRNTSATVQLQIPVPKGKLREAIEVQEKLRPT